jgi:hypothetical protein
MSLDTPYLANSAFLFRTTRPSVPISSLWGGLSDPAARPRVCKMQAFAELMAWQHLLRKSTGFKLQLMAYPHDSSSLKGNYSISKGAGVNKTKFKGWFGDGCGAER